MSNIIRNATRITYQPLNIIVAPYDGKFELSICQNTPHTLYMISEMQKIASDKQSIKHDRLQYLNTNVNNWPIELDFDLIICSDITMQISMCSQISKFLHIPMLIIHHVKKPDFVKNEDIQILNDNYIGDTIISMSNEINNSWYANFPVLPYYFDTTDSRANCPHFMEAWASLFDKISKTPFIG
jgi:hypothetical protein